MRALLLIAAVTLFAGPLARAEVAERSVYGPVALFANGACPTGGTVPGGTLGPHGCFEFGPGSAFQIAVEDASGSTVGFTVTLEFEVAPGAFTHATYGPFCGQASVPGIASALDTSVFVDVRPSAGCTAIPTAGTISVTGA